jgi:acetyl esterase/lipase
MKIHSLLIAIFGMATTALAQQELQLYPAGKIPYNLKETHKTYAKPVISPEGFQTKVGIPSLTYFAPTGAPNGGAVMICPGGGYQFTSLNNEGFAPAAYFAKLGYAAFILNYRLPDTALIDRVNRRWVPLSDAIQGMAVIKANAAGLGIDTNRIGVIGFSAGGHLAAMLATNPNKHPFGELSDRPAWVALIYAITSMYQGHDPSRRALLGGNGRIRPDVDTLFSPALNVIAGNPPVFILHTQDDPVVPVSNATRYSDAVTAKGGKADVHIYTAGGHGYGLAEGVNSPLADWPRVFENWLKGR